MQTMTRGKLLWSSLIQDLYSKNRDSFEGSEERYLKMEGFKSNPKNRSTSQISKPWIHLDMYISNIIIYMTQRLSYNYEYSAEREKAAKMN